MNEQQIGQADAWWTSAEKFFAAHPLAKWIALAWVFGWVVAFIVRPFIRMSPLSDAAERKLVVLVCILASGAAAFRMWDGDYGIIVSIVMGGTSIFGYLAVTALICKWKPDLAPYLSLRKDFTAVVEEDNPPEPPKP